MPGMTERSIGELAEVAGVNVETVRYYERRGLLAEPPRTASGYRVYDDDALWRLEFVGRAKQLGFTLTEIKELVAAGEAGSVSGIVDAARTKLHQVDERLTELAASQSRLRQLVDTCTAGDEEDCFTLDVTRLTVPEA
jgi:DNA-binding transcriptional MerR regulator